MVKKISKVAAPKTKKGALKKEVIKKEVIKKAPASSVVYAARVNRLYGQVGGVKKMIEGDKGSVEILIQLKAVRAAIKALEAEILEAHLLSSAADLSLGNVAQKSKKMADLKKVFSRFE